MYVITFYSFKGGVGRTMALVNVAAELVRRGRKVLVVDFDLEAPGLETYKHLKPPKPHPGIVEFVTDFRRTWHAPEPLDYIYETKPIGKKGGQLWVMPAGRRDTAYRSALANLDWQRLYKEEDGFLLFEDAKKGWEEGLKPDYVLIDSRTGDTDVLGICTRQLPDAVVLMFTPNEQNRTGLEGVCPNIRREETQGLKKKIRLHFVAANVPNLDDENRVLHRQMRTFRKRLQFRELSGVIRRYDNLNLLDQSVFTLDRPHTRLARSYRRLLRTLLQDNPADREAAMLFLQRYSKRRETRIESNDGVRPRITMEGRDGQVLVPDAEGRFVPSIPQMEDKGRLHGITTHFKGDVEILNKAARCYMLEEDYRSAVRVFDGIVQLDRNRAYALYARAVCRIHLAEIDDAADDLLSCLRVLGSCAATDPAAAAYFQDSGMDLTRVNLSWKLSIVQQTCIQKLCAMAPSKLPKLGEMVETGQVQGVALPIVTGFLCRREEGVPIAARLLRNYIAASPDQERAVDLKSLSMGLKSCVVVQSREGQAAVGPNSLSVGLTSLLQARCWREVIQSVQTGKGEPQAGFLFCLALAHWGESGEMPESVCRQALECAHHDDLATLGLVAVAWLLWRVGQVADAFEALDVAEQREHAETDEVFSWWRIRDVSVAKYLDDCQLTRRMFQGEPLRPAFLGPPAPARQT